MKIAMIGAGKLGFPVGCIMASKGFDVTFCDINESLLENYKQGNLPNEVGLPSIHKLAQHNIHFTTDLCAAVHGVDFVFIAVQTPHVPEQDGSVRFHHVKADFDLSHVKRVIQELQNYFVSQKIVIISTMLPGSMDREILPLWVREPKPIYSPYFVAMGTVVDDFLNPEFWLVGADSYESAAPLIDFYTSINDKVPVFPMSYSSAEATKVLYNTHITMKITLANLAMELAHHTPKCNVDDISTALEHATKRIVSPRYMRGGMVDGGSCHPRDNIAMSWLSDLDLDYNLFDMMMEIREKQVEFLASLVANYDAGRPVVILGKTFKANSDITAGSPALLLGNLLQEIGITPTFFDFNLNRNMPLPEPSVYVVAVRDEAYCRFPFADDSVIVDPWGIIKKVPDTCKLISVGRH